MKHKIQNGWFDTGDALWAHYCRGTHTGLIIARPSQSKAIYHARFYPQDRSYRDKDLFSCRSLEVAQLRAEKLLPKLRKA